MMPIFDRVSVYLVLTAAIKWTCQQWQCFSLCPKRILKYYYVNFVSVITRQNNTLTCIQLSNYLKAITQNVFGFQLNVICNFGFDVSVKTVFQCILWSNNTRQKTFQSSDYKLTKLSSQLFHKFTWVLFVCALLSSPGVFTPWVVA